MKRSRKKQDVLIDLTSLLDIVFILLFVVLCGQQMVGNDINRMQEEVKEEQIQVQALKELYEDQLEAETAFNEMAVWVSVTAPYNSRDVRQREIYVLERGGNPEKFSMVGNDVDHALKGLEQALVNCIERNADKPVMLSLDEKEAAILYRDETAIMEVFTRLSGKYKNVFIRSILDEE